MTCTTSACNGFITCQQQLDCPVGRCLQEYIPPAKLPQEIVTNKNSLGLFSQGSGTSISPMEIGITDSGTLLEVQQIVAGIPWDGVGGITPQLYFMNVRKSNREIQEDKTILYYGQGDRNPIIIFYQDPSSFIWYIWKSESGVFFTGTTREYIQMIPLIVEDPPGIWDLNRGQDTNFTAVFTADATPTLVDFTSMFYAWDASNPLQNSNSTLLYGTTIALQGVDLVEQAGGSCPLDPFNCTAQTWFSKGNDQLFLEDFCIVGQPLLLAYDRSEIRSSPSASISSGSVGTTAPFCENVNCIQECTLFYFMVTESNGCLPPLVDSGAAATTDNTTKTMWIVIGVLLGVIFLLGVIWLIISRRK